MAKLSLDELRKIREKEHERLKKRDIHGRKKHVVVSMGTCGLNAGAKIVLNAIADECEKLSLDDVIITQSPCLGRCEDEPVVEVHTPELGTVVYGKVDKKIAKEIVEKHLKNGIALEINRIELEA